MTAGSTTVQDRDMDFAAARLKMVDNQIRTTDVTDWAILRAFLDVAREDFVPAEQRELAYIGGDIPLGRGRSLMAASPFARLLQLLVVGREHRVLDLGSGTGYSAAILTHLAGEVVAVEEDGELAAAARAALGRHGGVSLVEAAPNAGYAGKAPYDRIMLEGAVEEVPDALFAQLAEGGRLVAVEGRGNAAAARVYLKEQGVVSNRFAFNCGIPELPGFARPKRFTF